MKYNFMLSFLEGPFCVQPFKPFLTDFFPFLSWLCPFLKIQIVCFAFVFRLFVLFCFVFSDLKVVFKRIIYPVVSWF